MTASMTGMRRSLNLLGATAAEATTSALSLHKTSAGFCGNVQAAVLRSRLKVSSRDFAEPFHCSETVDDAGISCYGPVSPVR